MARGGGGAEFPSDGRVDALSYGFRRAQPADEKWGRAKQVLQTGLHVVENEAEHNAGSDARDGCMAECGVASGAGRDEAGQERSGIEESRAATNAEAVRTAGPQREILAWH